MEVLQLDRNILYLQLNFVEPSGDSLFIAFLQNIQSNNIQIGLNFINIHEKNFILLQNEYEAFILRSEDACLPQYERFFANIKFFADTERDLPLILHNLHINIANIDDHRIGKSLIGSSSEVMLQNIDVPFFKISQNNENYEINFAYIKSILIKGFEITQTLAIILNNLKYQNKFEIYRSIISEKFKKIKFFTEGRIQEISDIYNVLDFQSQESFMSVYTIFKDVALQQKMPLSCIITVHAIESLILKTPQTFEDISNIFGLNKKIVHNAIIRKVLRVFFKKKFNIKRNKAFEMIIEALLHLKSTEYGIDKHFIASKHDIIALLNENLNVDFLKGWKKSIFGTDVMDFIHNKSSIQVQNMQLFIFNK